jgi:hypothetical protein
MDFKKLISQLDQLHEADVKHKGTYGTSYQGDDDEDDDKKTAPASTEKRGRGRPKKAVKYSGAKDLQSMIVGNIPKDSKELKNLPKTKNKLSDEEPKEKKSTTESLKDWISMIDEQRMLAEEEYTTSLMPGAVAVKRGGKVVATAKDQEAAKAITNGDITLGSEEMKEGEGTGSKEELAKRIYGIEMSIHGNYGPGDPKEDALLDQLKAQFAQQFPGENAFKIGSEISRKEQAAKTALIVSRLPKPMFGNVNTKRMFGGDTKPMFGQRDESMSEGEDEGKPGKNFAKIAKSAGKHYGSKEAGERVAGAVRAKLMKQGKIKEAALPTHDGDAGAGLGAGRSNYALEGMAKGKKPDFVDLDKDGDKKESMKKAASDAKKGKKKVAEGMDQRCQAAYHKGRSNGLVGEAHCGKNYEDSEEARHYHMGFMEGIDECYGGHPMPIQGYVGEMSNEVEDMASYGAYTPELDEMDKTAYMKQQAIKTPGKTFNAFGQTMHDSDVLDEFAFESLDRQLNALLNEDSVSEGMTVSISKGQENSPDSVSINASDAEADSLLAFVKQAGLGIFGGDDHGDMQDAVVTSEPSIASSDAIEVVDDHDGMLSLIRKMAGQGAAQPAHDHSSEDYADEEETCNECGMAYESCGGKHGGEMVDEMQNEFQLIANVAEDNPPDTGAAETEQEVQDVAQANSSAASFDKAQAAPQAAADLATESEEDEEDEEDEEQKDGLDESSFFNLYKKLALLSEESTAEKDAKAEKAGKKVAKDIEYDEGHKGKDDNKAEEAGKKVTKDIEYDDKKDKKLDEWANSPQQSSHDEQFETDIDFMTNIISGGLNKQKIRVGSGGQTTVPVVATVTNESTDLLTQWKKLSGLK